MSLRARLIAGLVLVAAAGLVLLGGIVYAQQRSFLIDRVDEQVHAAPPALAHQLAGHRAGGPVAGGAANGRRPDPDDGRGGGGGPREAPANLPPGTYGELRDAAGRSVTSTVLSYGQSEPAKPKLPRALPEGEIRTVGSAGGAPACATGRSRPVSSGARGASSSPCRSRRRTAPSSPCGSWRGS